MTFVLVKDLLREMDMLREMDSWTPGKTWLFLKVVIHSIKYSCV